MQFKHPEFLYFLFLLIIPILVHLFQLRKFKKELFTNVKFLQELAIQTRKSSKIKKYLLLSARMLLLAALIVAFAQPFFKALNNDKVSNEIYLVLDNSFSMQAKGKKGELLKRAVQDLLEHTPQNLTFNLLTNSDNFYNTNIKSIQQDLQNLNYSASSFNLNSILARINARKSATNKDIVVITDAVGLVQSETKSFKKEDKAYFQIPKAEQSNNVSVDSVYINQTLDNFYEIAVKIDAFSDEIKSIPISLFNNNKLTAKTLVDFDSKSKTINFTIPKEDFHGFVSVDDNGLEYDNNYYFSISKPEKSKVISIGENAKSKFLSRIFSPKEFIFNNFEINSLDYNIINKQDAIVLNELIEIPQALQTTLKTFSEKGGNIVVIPSKDCSLENLNSLMHLFGVVQFKSLITKDKLLTKINYSHPLYSGVFEKKVENFQYPNSKSSFEITSSTPQILINNDQTPFLTAIENNISSVYIFTTPLNKENSNFQNSPLIVPTFFKMAQNKQKSGVNALTIGEDQSFIVETNVSKDEIVSIKNNSEKKENYIPIQQILNNKVKLTFNDSPEKAGNYSAFNKNKKIDNLSFNYNRKESNLNNVNNEIANDFEEINNLETFFNTLENSRTDSQIWKWFVILALLFLALEIVIQKFVK